MEWNRKKNTTTAHRLPSLSLPTPRTTPAVYTRAHSQSHKPSKEATEITITSHYSSTQSGALTWSTFNKATRYCVHAWSSQLKAA